MTEIPKEILRDVQKPARYVGGEPGQVIKDPDSVSLRFAMCFPDGYEIGMSHLGLRILYSRLNRIQNVWCERAFAPFPDMEKALRDSNHRLTTLESGTPLSEMDILGFSLQHELCFTNVLLMLDLGGVPLRSTDRGENDPLVVAGGPTACHPEPIAPFFDAIALGDGEETSTKIAQTWQKARSEGASRIQALEQLAKLDAVYVPQLAQLHEDPQSNRLVVTEESVARAARISDLEDYPFPTDGPVAITEAVFDRAMAEIARGCGGGCRFCQAGMIYRPVRERNPKSILNCLTDQISHGGYDEASLTSLSTADYSQIRELVQGAATILGLKDVALSVSSLRAFGLDQSLSEALAKVRTSSLTLAPEAATERLRNVINKNITEDDILRGAQAAITGSRSRIKLYFMIGLPTETEEDLRAIADLALKIRKSVAGRSKKRASITVSASTFIPKPHTPLQWARAIGPEEVRDKQILLKKLLGQHRIESRFHDVRLSMLEVVLARADRRAADLIEDAYRRGARFDGWDEYFDNQAWNSAYENWPISQESLRAEIPDQARLPWDHLDVGPSKSFLAREYRRALSARPTSPCLRYDEKGELICHGCGVECDLEVEKSRFDEKKEEAKSISEWLEEPRTKTERGTGHKYRLIFQKRGDLIWVGHLDTVRLISRMFRRADVKIAYSKGYHPKPKLVFAAPLPLGIIGLREILDFVLEDSVDPEELLVTLRKLSPKGLVPVEVTRIEEGQASASKLLVGSELLVASPDLQDDLRGLIDSILSKEKLVVDRGKKGPIDLRFALRDLFAETDEELLSDLGISDPAVRAHVELGKGPSVRGEYLLSWLGCSEKSAKIIRVRLLQEPFPTTL